MKPFKSFLLEYLTDAQRQQYSQYKMTDKARADTDHFFGVGNDKVTGALGHTTDKSEIHRKIEKHLGAEISHDDYRAGITKDKYGRDVRIGRVIKDDKLKAEYAKDPTREGAKVGSQFTTSTVRGIEVAGQTNPEPNAEHPKGHSWRDLSCKNVTSGIQRHILANEIERGTVVHFVHDRNGQEIYRATLHPHHNQEGHVAYAVDSEYGIKHPAFMKSARDTAEKLSGELKGSPVFEKDREVYDDSGVSHMIHPSVSSEGLTNHLKSSKFTERYAVLRHKNVTPEHIEMAVNDSNRHVRREVAKSLLLKPEHITKIMDNPNENSRVKMEAVQNPNATAEHISKALDSDDHDVRLYAMRNPNVNADHISKALDVDQPHHIRQMALQHRKVTPSHIAKVLSHNPRVLDRNTLAIQEQAAAHPNASKENIDQALQHREHTVRELAINNRNATDEQISRGLDDPHPMVRISARYAKKAREQ
jgi:hypothetical protein